MRLSHHLVRVLSTFFYLGYLPLIPGTFGSLVGILLFYLVKNNQLAYISVTFALMILGFILSSKAEKIFNQKDPRPVVIDEVVGILLSLLFLPSDIKLVVTGFVLFRLLDALKPYPVNRLEKLPGGWGIMLDDIVAGLYTNIILQVSFRLASLSFS
jgi:phosphatidylglycerophosphatase A